MHKFILFFISLFLSSQLLAESEDSEYFVFVGKKISLTPVTPKLKENKSSFDSKFLAKYQIIKPYKGSYHGAEIEFTVFDHYGVPQFSEYDHVLLYVVLHDGKYYHSKYQFTPVYKTKSGVWAGAYAAYDYTHSNNANTTIKPVKIDFYSPVEFDISGYEQEEIEVWFPQPYYNISGNRATAVYGNYLNELFFLKQQGVLKARGDFQQM